MESKATSKSDNTETGGNSEGEEDDLCEFPEDMSIDEKFSRLVHITQSQRRKIRERDKIIRDLVDEVKKRDRILELSSAPGDHVEVDKIGDDLTGRVFYEIRNKEQVPFMIKTERLSPTPMQIDWEKLNKPENFENESDDEVFIVSNCTEQSKTSEDMASQVHTQMEEIVQEQQHSVSEPEDQKPFQNDDEVQILYQNIVPTPTPHITPLAILEDISPEVQSQIQVQVQAEESMEPQVSQSQSEDLEDILSLEDGELCEEDEKEDVKSFKVIEDVQANPTRKKAPSPVKFPTKPKLKVKEKVKQKLKQKLKLNPSPSHQNKQENSVGSNQSQSQSQKRQKRRRNQHKGQEDDLDLHLAKERSPLEKRAKSGSREKINPRLSIKIRVSSDCDSPRRVVTQSKGQSPERSWSSSSRGKASTSTSIISSASSNERHSDRHRHTHGQGHSKGHGQGRHRPPIEDDDPGLIPNARIASATQRLGDRNYRHSFALSDDLNSSLTNFWSPPSKCSRDIKYLVKLHGGDHNWEQQLFTLVEQNGVDPVPKVTMMDRRLQDIELKLNFDYPDLPRLVWLEFRGFPIFSPDFAINFNIERISSMGCLITHLTLGQRLYNRGNLGKIDSNIFLESVFKFLPNLQFLAINSDGLDFSDDKYPVRDSKRQFLLKDLKLLKLLRCNGKDDQRVIPTASFFQGQSQIKSPLPVKATSRFSREFFAKIWHRSPELKRLYGIPLELLKHLGSGAKSNIRSICILSYRNQAHYSVVGQVYLDHLKLALEFCSHLEELDTRTYFIHPWQETYLRSLILQTLSSILEKNSDTLIKLKVEPEGPRNMLEVPVCKNLTTLTFCLNSEAWQIVVPFFGTNLKDSDFVSSFPNLKNVEISNVSPRNDVKLWMFEKCFPAANFPPDAFFRVESLFLKNLCAAETFPRIANMFPNIRYLRLNDDLRQIRQILPLVFNFMPKLQQLQLEVDTDGCLDSGLTGIDLEGLRELKKNPYYGSVSGKYFSDINKRATELRTTKSMLDLPNLTFLRIVLRSGDCLKDLSASNPILSPLSAYFGFGFLCTSRGLEASNVKVQIGFDEAVGFSEKEIILESLQPMLPFVTLES